MAERKSVEDKTQSEIVSTKFPLERIRRDCERVIGVSKGTFDGATSGLKGEFTIDEIRGITETWLRKPVITKGAK